MIEASYFQRIDADVNGNPRYYVPAYHFSKDMTERKRLLAGLVKYGGRKFGKGYVVQSYNLDATVDYINKTLELE